MTTDAPIPQDPLAFVSAPRGTRVIAFGMDYAATILVTSAVAGPLILAGDFSDTDGFHNPAASSLGLVAVFVIPLLSFVLNIYLMHAHGYTVGKRIMGLRVVDIDTGATLGWGRAVVRVLVLFAPLALGQVLSGIVILFAPVIAVILWAISLSIARPPLRRTWQDLAARSIVVIATPPAAGPAAPENAVQQADWR